MAGSSPFSQERFHVRLLYFSSFLFRDIHGSPEYIINLRDHPELDFPYSNSSNTSSHWIWPSVGEAPLLTQMSFDFCICLLSHYVSTCCHREYLNSKRSRKESENCIPGWKGSILLSQLHSEHNIFTKIHTQLICKDSTPKVTLNQFFTCSRDSLKAHCAAGRLYTPNYHGYDS